MPEARGHARRVDLPVGPSFIDECARHIIETCGAPLPDLTTCTIVVPNLALAPAVRAALARAAKRALLLPRICSLTGLADNSLANAAVSEAERRVGLFEQLERRGWFSEGARWEICSELIELFDALTERALDLPETHEEFVAQLERVYHLRSCEPLRFEARVIHELWRAESVGLPSLPAARALALARVAFGASGPLFIIGDGELLPVAETFLRAWAQRAPAYALVPTRAANTEDGLLELLNAAWPVGGVHEASESLRYRAVALGENIPGSPLARRVRFFAANTLEEEADTVVRLVRQWLADGKRDIALIAADRVAARRARALLARHDILVEDETGWKLSTTRAAALIDAWLEVVSSEAYHRDVLDLLKSPFLFSDLALDARRRAVVEIESCIARGNLVCGLERYEAALRDSGASETARELLSRILVAQGEMATGDATLTAWLDRLLGSLERLGAMRPLADDAAGRSVLELLRGRREELAASALRLNFGTWREWLNHELEESMFRDRSIASPVVMTHLAAARLRGFEAAVIIGADDEHLSWRAQVGLFANAAVRAELGLGTPQEDARRQENDLAYLVVCSGEVAATWQQWRGHEANLLNPALARLSLLHEAAYGDNLYADLPRISAGQATSPHPTARPAPAAPADRLPREVPVSAYATLVTCPYRFFACYVLGLSEQDEVQEALQKRDYGTLVHACLDRFHERFPTLKGHTDTELVSALEEITREEFAPAVSRNFLEAAWQTRWCQRIPAYFAWQRAREEEGWRFAGGEVKLRGELALADGSTLQLHGRIDRIDRLPAQDGEGGRVAVIDYKTRSRKRLKDQLADDDSDVQLALYAALYGPSAAQAAYVALDDETIAAVALDDAQEQARRQQARLTSLYEALISGAGMPANAPDEDCAYCEMRGLCRKGHWN